MLRKAIGEDYVCRKVGTWIRPMDGKIKAPPSGRRKWLVGLKFFGIRHGPPDGGSGTFLKTFIGPTAIHRLSHERLCR